MPSTGTHPILSNQWVIVLGSAILLALVLIFLRWIVLSRLRKLADRTRFNLDSHLAKAISLPLTLVTIALYVTILSRFLEGAEILEVAKLETANGISKILFIVAFIAFLDSFTTGFIASYAVKSSAIRNSKSIISGSLRALFICIGALVLLSTLGISITPIIASLGITSLAVALALQPTLENFFSGVQLVIDKPIRVGDYIELDSGEQGFVERIGWRTTWIKMLQNNTVIIPNSELSKSKIINYFYPSKELSVPVDVGVHYNSESRACGKSDTGSCA